MAHDTDAAPHVEAVDPRQGTLLGFERPAGAPVSLPSKQAELAELAAAEIGTVAVDRAEPGKRPAAEAGKADELALELETPAAADKATAFEPKAVSGSEKPRAAGRPATAEKAVAGENAAASKKPATPSKPIVVEAMSSPEQALSPEPVQAALSSSDDTSASAVATDSPDPKLLSPGAALASGRRQAARRPADAARPSVTPAAQPAEPAQPADAFPAAPVPPAAPAPSAAPPAGDALRSIDGAVPPDLAQTVASLQEALVQERSAAQERWRRTRHWLALASAGLVLLFAVSVAQTVALVGFAHHAQAAQQQTQSALNDQQAALAGLASSTSALAARLDSPLFTVSAPDASVDANGAPRPPKHVKPAHTRHVVKDKTKLAAR